MAFIFLQETWNTQWKYPQMCDYCTCPCATDLLIGYISYLAVPTLKEIMASGVSVWNQREDTLCSILLKKGGL